MMRFAGRRNVNRWPVFGVAKLVREFVFHLMAVAIRIASADAQPNHRPHTTPQATEHGESANVQVPVQRACRGYDRPGRLLPARSRSCHVIGALQSDFLVLTVLSVSGPAATSAARMAA